MFHVKHSHKRKFLRTGRILQRCGRFALMEGVPILNRLHTLKRGLSRLIERVSVQFLTMAICALSLTCILVFLLTMIPVELIAFFGYMGLVGFVLSIIFVYVAVGVGAAAFWQRACKAMLSEGTISGQVLFDDQNTLSFLLWAMSSLLGLLSLGMGIFPEEAIGQTFTISLFLLTCMFFTLTLAVDYVFRFKGPKMVSTDGREAGGSQ